MSKRTAAPRWGKFLLFSCLTLVVTTGGVFGIGRQWLQEAEQAGRGSQPSGQVLAAEDEVAEGLPDALIFRIKTEFLDLMQAQQVQVSERLVVDGETILNGGLTVEGGAAFAGDIAFDAITVSGDISITDGDITAEGSNINLGDGTITASNIVYEVLAGDGISIDGTQTVTITNDDRGSAQKIFGKVKVGDVTLTADSNTDTLTLSAGSGVNLGTNTSDNEITISADNLSGWYKPSSTIVSLITSTNNVGIGTSAPTNKLEIDSGSTNVSGLSFTQLTSGSPSGVGGGKVLSLDSGGRVILVTDQTGDTPTAESVLPDAETGGTLYFNGTNWVSSTNLFHNGGSVGISTTSPAGRFHTYTNAIGTIGAVIQGYSGQTANLQEWRNGAGSILSYIDADGVFNGSANVAGSIDPGLTQGQVAFQGVDGLAGSNNLFWDNSTGNLGIGTTSPDQLLSINNVGTKPILYISSRYDLTSTLANQGIQMGEGVRRGDIDYNTAHFYFKNYYNSDAANIYFQTKASGTPVNAMTIAGSGNVGIGTTTPLAKLHIDMGTWENLFSDGTLDWKHSTGNNYGKAGIVTASNFGLESFVSYPIIFKTNATERMKIDWSGNIGIGTTTPTAKLEVGGASSGFKISGTYNTLNMYTRGSSPAASVLEAGGTYPALVVRTGSPVADRALFSQTGGLSLGSTYVTTSVADGNMIMSGNLGIGTTAPNASLNVIGTTYIRHTGGIGQIRLGDTSITSGTYDPSVVISIGSGPKSALYVYGAGSQGIANFLNGSTNVLHVGAANVGIGTTTPAYKFDVANKFQVDSALIPDSLLITRNSTYTGYTQVGTANLWLKSTGNMVLQSADASYGVRIWSNILGSQGDLQINPGGSEKMRITTGGNVGIGTASPGQALDVVGNARFSAVGSDAYASDLHLTADGTLTTAASDVRLKKDLVELNDDQVLGKLLQLKTYNFAWKSNNSQDIGMVAQEVAQVLPELTFTNPVDGYMGINYSRLPSLLISAMQAQQTQITTLQNTYKLSSTGTLQPTTQATQAAQPTQQPPTDQPWYTQLAEAITVIKETIFSKAVRFEALAQFMANTIFQGSAEFLGAAKFRKGAAIEGELSLNANQTGSAEVPAGATKITVAFSQPLSQVPQIILTPSNFITGQFRVTDKTATGFSIELSQPQTQAVKFDWQASVQADSQAQPSVTVVESGIEPPETESEPATEEAAPAQEQVTSQEQTGGAEQQTEDQPTATQSAAQVAGTATESAVVVE